MQRLLRSVLAASLLCAGLVACGESGDDGGSAAAPTTTGGSGTAEDAAALTGQTLRVGGNLELTGPGAAGFGIPNRQSFEITLDEIEASGLLGDNQIEIVEEDNGTDATQAVTVFNRFVSDGIPVVFESAYTPLLQALEPHANQNETVVISGFSSGTGDDAEDYVFRMADFVAVTVALAEYLVNDAGVESVAAVIDTQNEALVTIANGVESAIGEAGGPEFEKEIAIATADTDFSNVLTQIDDLAPDAVILAMTPAQAGNFLQQAESSDIDTLFVGHGGWGPQVADVAGVDAIEGVVLPQLFVPGQAGSDAFVGAYQERFSEPPSASAALAHDCLWLIAVAADQIWERGEEVTGPAMRDALPSASTSEEFQEHALLIDFEMDAAGVPTYQAVIGEFRDGVPQPVGA